MGGTTEPERDGRGRLGNVISGLAVAIGFVLFLGGFVWGALVYRPYTVPTNSMEPTVMAGDRVLAQRVDGSEVRRGDVVVFTDTVWSNVPMVKRVVGVGGDTVRCCGPDGRLLLNDAPLDEDYLGSDARPSDIRFEVKVPAGHVFLLGDRRTGSLDSRAHLQEAGQGTVPVGAITARMDAVVWPRQSMPARPQVFAGMPGGTSEPGPVLIQLAAIVLGGVFVLGGAAWGPVANLLAGRRGGRGGDTFARGDGSRNSDVVH
ncbi:signal peptidase I [Streptomyces sp. BI20]|uniref:signal peptidase I n=1 Tax=Streptomyces sp. BI20 TaxID=3403460 RepID=UPI003C71AACD